LLRKAERAQREGESIARSLFGTDRVPLVCCGGAPVRHQTLRALAALGIMVYEGYGLSENSSVVCWNRPGACRIGTVGQALPHAQLALGDDGELLVRSTSMFAGYTVEDPSSCDVDDDGWLHTGDLAQVDDDGYVTIVGRKKNVIVTSAGRNVAPEWVEAQYKSLPEVMAAAAIDDGDSALRGLFLVDTRTSLEQARAAITDFGLRQLSTVERVHAACLMPATQDSYARFFTVTGRPRRQELALASRQGSLEYTLLYPAPDIHNASDQPT
jgi:long-subunit acyl-CoA synthetase (AMP-forming)